MICPDCLEYVDGPHGHKMGCSYVEDFYEEHEEFLEDELHRYKPLRIGENDE